MRGGTAQAIGRHRRGCAGDVGGDVAGTPGRGRIHRRSVAALLLLVLAANGCGRPSTSSADGPTGSPQQIRFERNRAAYRVARGASDPAAAPTFREARYILAERIDPRDVTDPDLREYIGSLLRVANVCIEVGIERGTDPNPLKLLLSIDPGSATQAVLGKGLGQAAEEAKRIAGELTGLRAGMGRLEELERTLRSLAKITYPNHCLGRIE